MKKRSVFGTIFQILIAVIGTLGAVAVTYLFSGNLDLITNEEAGLGVLGILLLIPIQIIVSVIPMVFGLVGTIFAIGQRRKPETKDAFSLVMLILSIVQLVLPIILFGTLVAVAN